MNSRFDSITPATAGTSVSSKPRRRLLLLLPGMVFVGIGVLLFAGLFRDPSLVPSPLIGKPVPAFELPPVQGRALGLASADLRGGVSLLNVFASWCVACRDEHPLLVALTRSGTVPVHGLNYKDPPDDAARWLERYGDPYSRTGADVDGRVGIEWGVYGVPETFVVDARGHIAYKHIGPLTEADLRDVILPLVQKLRQQAGG